MPVELLIKMSESTADNNRLSFAVETRLHNLPEMEVGSLDPGCLTSEDEERETWTAESLRVSIMRRRWFQKNLGFQGVEAGRKTSAVHVYIGYTMIRAVRELFVWVTSASM